MTFKIVLLPPGDDPALAEKIRSAIPGVDATVFHDPKDATAAIRDADAAYGTVPPELLAEAGSLRWIAAARAGLGGAWFYEALVESDVVVTNVRGIYNDHLAAHALGFLLAFARRFDAYLPQQTWRPGPPMLDLASMTALIVGVGGAGAETARLCAALGLCVLGADPRTETPPPGVADLFAPQDLPDRIGEADFVILIAPETPETRGLFDANLFARMKAGAYFINVGRGVCVETDALIAALKTGHIAGAGLDVADEEPLPDGSPLWRMPNALITPHIAVRGAPYAAKAEAILLENCRRFAAGEPLLNVVDKRNWF